MIENQRRFLTAMLCRGRCEGLSRFAVQRARRPKPACLIQEVGHLRGYAPEARARANDDRIVIRQISDHRHGGRLIQHRKVKSRRGYKRQISAIPLHFRLANMFVRRTMHYQNLCHRNLLLWAWRIDDAPGLCPI